MAACTIKTGDGQRLTGTVGTAKSITITGTRLTAIGWAGADGKGCMFVQAPTTENITPEIKPPADPWWEPDGAGGAVPHLVLMTPNTFVIGQTPSVTITGSGFGEMSNTETKVWSDEEEQSSSFVYGDTNIGYTAVGAAAATRQITVRSPAGTSNALPMTVTPPPAPTLTSVAPASGPPVATVVVTGTSLGEAWGWCFRQPPVSGARVDTFASLNTGTEATMLVPAALVPGPADIVGIFDGPGGDTDTNAIAFDVTASAGDDASQTAARAAPTTRAAKKK